MLDGRERVCVPAAVANISNLRLLLAAKDGNVSSNGMSSLVGMKIQKVDEPGGHFDVHASSFNQASQAAIAWFREHLA